MQTIIVAKRRVILNSLKEEKLVCPILVRGNVITALLSFTCEGWFNKNFRKLNKAFSLTTHKLTSFKFLSVTNYLRHCVEKSAEKIYNQKRAKTVQNSTKKGKSIKNNVCKKLAQL